MADVLPHRMLDIFLSHGHNEVDTAYACESPCRASPASSADRGAQIRARRRSSTSGRCVSHPCCSERKCPHSILLQIDYKSRGVVVDTKLYPNPKLGVTHSAADLRKFIKIQLKALQADSMDMWYLRAPLFPPSWRAGV